MLCHLCLHSAIVLRIFNILLALSVINIGTKIDSVLSMKTVLKHFNELIYIFLSHQMSGIANLPKLNQHKVMSAREYRLQLAATTLHGKAFSWLTQSSAPISPIVIKVKCIICGKYLGYEHNHLSSSSYIRCQK